MSTSRIATKRAIFQWLATLTLLLVPNLKIGGQSLLRLDAPSRTLLFFGASIRIEEFYLFLIVVLILVFSFLFVTMLFGRVWCGWFCPQTTITDLAEFIDKKAVRLLPNKYAAGFMKQIGSLLISFVVASNLIWYFIPPGEYFSRLVHGNLGPVAGISLVAIFALVYFDLLFVRRLFCKLVCPYGRIQLLTMDRNTLTLEFNPLLKESCIRCGACTRTCPMGIDIRTGLQIECINCGRCLDACRGVMSRLKKDGLIHYTFGVTSEGGGKPLNRKSVMLGMVIIILSSLLLFGITNRQEATLKIQRASNAEIRQLPDGGIINFYTAFIENRSTIQAVYTLRVTPFAGFKAELIGPVRHITIDANANRKVDFVLKVSPVPASRRDLELQLMREETVVSATAVPLLLK